MIAGDLTTLANAKSWLAVSTTNDDALLSRLITASSQYIQSWLNRTFAVASQTEVRNGTGTQTMMFGDYPVVSVQSVVVNGTNVPASSDGISAGYVFDAKTIYLIGYVFPMGMQNVKITYTHGYQRTAEASSIPSAPVYAVPVSSLQFPWASDVGIAFAAGGSLAKVSGTPSASQYSISQVSGDWTYTFAAADAGKAIAITYAYTPQEIEQACIEIVSLRYRERSRIGENSKSIGGETVSYTVKDFPDSVKTILNNYRRVISVY